MFILSIRFNMWQSLIEQTTVLQFGVKCKLALAILS